MVSQKNHTMAPAAVTAEAAALKFSAMTKAKRRNERLLRNGTPLQVYSTDREK